MLYNLMLRAQDFIDLIGEDDHYDESSFEDHYREHLLKLVTAIEAIKAEHPKLDLKELKRMCVDEGTLNIDMKRYI
jgi:hypothetical protein